MSAMTLDDVLEESGRVLSEGKPVDDYQLVEWRQAIAIQIAYHAHMVEKVRKVIESLRTYRRDGLHELADKLAASIGDAK